MCLSVCAYVCACSFVRACARVRLHARLRVSARVRVRGLFLLAKGVAMSGRSLCRVQGCCDCLGKSREARACRPPPLAPARPAWFVPASFRFMRALAARSPPVPPPPNLFSPSTKPQGEFGANATIMLVSHGLTLRVFMMRWFNWSVEQFLQVYNPPNASPVRPAGPGHAWRWERLCLHGRHTCHDSALITAWLHGVALRARRHCSAAPFHLPLVADQQSV
jgi:hypothetical protein